MIASFLAPAGRLALEQRALGHFLRFQITEELGANPMFVSQSTIKLCN
jgi:hypothetical protein